jgi:hypothetical protein
MHTDGFEGIKWLLIIDNHHFDYNLSLELCWPASKSGAILVTTRDVLAATVPVSHGIEVREFDEYEGSAFLLHMAHGRKRVSEGSPPAAEITKELEGFLWPSTKWLCTSTRPAASLVNSWTCTQTMADDIK